jgi:hypothetical protein
MSTTAIDRDTARQLKAFMRSGPYTDIGGYPLAAIMRDSSCLCHDCVKADFKLILRSTLWPESPHDQWAIAGVSVNWENDDLSCDDCGQAINSAYGDGNND